MPAPPRTPVRSTVLQKWKQIHQGISRANGYNYDVTADRVHKWRRITPLLPTPSISLFSGAEQVDSGAPRSASRYTVGLSVTSAFVGSFGDLAGRDLDLEPDDYGDLFIADIEEVVGTTINAQRSFAFEIQAPRFKSTDPRDLSDVQTWTVWGQEVDSYYMMSDAMPNKVYGEVNFLLYYQRSVFSPYAV